MEPFQAVPFRKQGYVSGKIWLFSRAVSVISEGKYRYVRRKTRLCSKENVVMFEEKHCDI